jgi:hypothetical protein
MVYQLSSSNLTLRWRVFGDKFTGKKSNLPNPRRQDSSGELLNVGKEVMIVKWTRCKKDTFFHLVLGSLSFSFSLLMTFSSSPLWAYFDDFLQIVVHSVLRVLR